MAGEDKKSFMEELQSLNESTKKIIVVATTIIIMAIVVYAWLGYFNGLVTGVSPQSASVGSAVGNQQGSAGGYNFGSGIENWAASMVNTLRGPGQYVVTPK